jgi:hypothetical protein
MINESLHCPNCGHCGYIVATRAADLDKLVATVCHYCGHFLDRDGFAECLAPREARRNTGKLR